MKKILKFLNDYLEETICIILMSVMTIIIFIQVIMRYVMHNSLSWSEELARYCFVWLIYIGVAYGCKLMKHIKIDAALKLFPEKVRPYITIVGELLVLAFAAYIVVTGVELTYKQWLFGKVSPLGEVPLAKYGTPSTDEIPDAVAEYLDYYDAVLLENHGALTYSDSLMNAYFKMESLEFYARLLYQAKMLGGPKELPEEQVLRLYSMRSQYGLTGRHPADKLKK